MEMNFRAYEPPSGGWTRRDAAHLLWRTQFGATSEEIEQAFEAGPGRTIERLLTVVPETSGADAILREAALSTENITDLKAWWLNRMLRSPNPLVERMTLFWHNHFATSNSKVKSVPFMADQNDLLRLCALGSFRDLLTEMSRDVAMLVWLDGNANRKRQPNENFAREVMELFSLGVDNYTEQDIKEAARAFTGWQVRGNKFWFNKTQHDDSVKKILGVRGQLDGSDVIEICLDQPACPRFLAEKLLREFVLPRPSESMVAELGKRIRKHDYRMTPVLRELLGSELFFGPAARGSIIKSPLDHVLGTFRALGVQPNLQSTARLLAELGQDVFEPPTVKGWEGGRLWINSATLLLRANFVSDLLGSNRFGEVIDPFEIAERNRLEDPESVVRFYVDLLLYRDLDQSAIDDLVKYLRQAQGDRSQRLKGLLHLVLTMPEYQLI